MEEIIQSSSIEYIIARTSTYLHQPSPILTPNKNNVSE